MTKGDRFLVMVWATVGVGYLVVELIDNAADAWGVQPITFAFCLFCVAVFTAYLTWCWYRTVEDIRA